ncbi:AAA family ATPase [Fulvivirgaceae bacterium BMA10]|uniref:AAA family ATPase n=1 Tax=Splendidivirga corallicola TaxID=3051826 RepID=A0ABT8KM91_9BACT|nr:AAA family ATPase [Fulvivirgaceae bacterium BMA10]
MRIEKITIKNYKSIRLLEEFPLNEINILIGSNGVGKTNFISFLKLLKQIADKNLQNYVAEQSGANSILYYGLKKSSKLSGSLDFSNKNAYYMELKASNDDSFFFSQERALFHSHSKDSQITGYRESRLDEMAMNHKKMYGYGGIPEYVQIALADFEIYHFHDTSRSSPIKQTCNINDNRFLRRDGSNLAAFLLYLKEAKPISLKKIESTIRQIAPFFDSFILKPLRRSPENIRLEWKEKGNDEYFNAHQLSDGTIRMVALATLLLQPEPPSTIIIDEPELGLHPAAIQTLAALIRKASQKAQIIVSTQSVTLVNQFNYEDLIIVERLNKGSSFRRLQQIEIESWLEDYSLGDAWEKNILGGRP